MNEQNRNRDMEIKNKQTVTTGDGEEVNGGKKELKQAKEHE